MKNNNFLSWLRQWYILIIIFIIYIPLVFIIFLSFTNASDKGNIDNDFIWNGGNNFTDLVNNSDFVTSLLNSLIIAIVVTPISLIISTLACFGLWHAAKVYRSSSIFLSKVSVVTPDIINGVSLLLLFSVTWIAIGFDFGFTTLILAHISFSVPYGMITIYPRMIKMNNNLIYASNDLGYNQIQTFFKVIIPYLLPSIIAAGAIIFSISFDDFIISSLINGRITTISIDIFSMAKGIKMWAVTFGALVVLTTIAVIIIISIFKAKKINKNTSSKKMFKYNNSIRSGYEKSQ